MFRCFARIDEDGQPSEDGFEPQFVTGWGYLQPALPIGTLEARGLSLSLDDFNEDLGVQILQAVRETSFRLHPPPYEQEGCLCGGYIEQTIVGEDWIEQRIVHRWPDQIGRILASGSAETSANDFSSLV